MKKETKLNRSLTPLSQNLRKNMTPAEKHLWYDFLKPHPLNFSRQKVLGKYIADFYCAAANLVIEVDGRQHYTEQGLKSDEARTKYLEAFGIRVIRITNYEINYKFDYICNYIEQEIKISLTSLGKEPW